jgi:hypothetical protein
MNKLYISHILYFYFLIKYKTLLIKYHIFTIKINFNVQDLI